jgi:hypothetical protein
MTLILLVACTPPPGESAAAPEAVPFPTTVDWGGDARYLTALEGPRLLRRMSLDLRGVFPSEDDLDAVEADPTALDAIRDDYLGDARLEDRLVSLFSERWATEMDTYEVGASDYGLPPDQTDAFAHAVGEEPLRLMAHVVAEDLPWSGVVTADYTMSNELLASIWPIDYPDAGVGWEPSTYTDGRPAAGVLSTNGLWWRYVTNQSNKSRGRIAAISKLLLCTDILSRPVVFQRTSEADPEQALRTNPDCLACHSAIDPAAASLFGFWWVVQYNPYEMQTYHPEREPLGPSLLGVDPAWFGTPIDGLVDLGWEIAHDPRFVRCGAQSMAEQLWRRDATLGDFAEIEALRKGFVASGEKPLELIRAVTDTPEYRAGAFTADAPDAVRARERVERLLTPNQLGTLIEDESGFVWKSGGFTQLENDVLGYRTLRGGVDGYAVSDVQTQPGITWLLVNQRVAEAAAWHIVQRDLIAGEHTTLRGVDDETTPDDPAFAEELASLHWRWYGERADDAWITSITDLWSAVAAEETPPEAWIAVLDAMIRDPKFQAY